MKSKHKIISLIIIAQISNFSAYCSMISFSIQNLKVEYTATPIGIDIEKPLFSWQMKVSNNKRGYKQLAYQIIVKDPLGSIVWDSKKTKNGSSVAIIYEGDQLKASTRYNWTVTVWNQEGVSKSSSSWFETGLMDSDPKSSAWEGAKWIGGDDNDLVFFSHYLSVFKLKYTLAIEKGSTQASFIYGANDLRLMDKNKNISQVENAKDESYIKLELDITELDGSPDRSAKLNIYRIGYTNEKKEENNGLIKMYDISTSIINNENKFDKHNFEIRSAFGNISIQVDGKKSFSKNDENSVNLNPMGLGSNCISFGMVCDIGFSLDAGQKASFSNVEIVNDRFPNSTLFKEDLILPDYDGIFAKYLDDVYPTINIKRAAYILNGGNQGTFIVANPSKNSTPMLRTEFKVQYKKIANARLYATARGIYEIFLNGKKVGNDYYNPGLTQYNKTHLYQTYDITNIINKGNNAIGAMMGEGWWSGLLSYKSIWNHFGDRQSLLAKLVIDYTDGTKDVITTNDRDWKYFNDGPLIYSSFYMGEVYDATRENLVAGWDMPGFDDSLWEYATEVSLENTVFEGDITENDGSITPFYFDEMRLVGQIGNNAGIFKILNAQSVKEVREGVFVYDMGQNIVGVPRITLADGLEGDTMILRVAEMYYPDLPEYGNNIGMIMTENYRAALSQDIYIIKEGQQVFQPHFTSHGYQYIEITGIKEPLPLAAVQGVAISSVDGLTAQYSTSNEKVNQLWSNLVWSNVDNFLTVPTDCPQRNERMGWSGDISIFSRTATYISECSQFLRRHMMAMRDVQSVKGRFSDIAPVGGGFGGVLWGSAGITVPWEAYQQYNDLIVLAENYNAMVDYIDYINSTIGENTGIRQLGDWLGPQNKQLGPDFLISVYRIYDLWIMSNTAKLLGKDRDVQKYLSMYHEYKNQFNSTFINQEHKTLCRYHENGEIGLHTPKYRVADTQTSYAIGLALGAFSDENIPYMVKNLVETVKRKNIDDEGILRPEFSLMTGFIGTAWISKALSDHGYIDLAYKLLLNDKYPSWLYEVNQGATTIWERLNSYTIENGFGGNNRMNSFNHYTFGAIGQWMMAYSLGIQRGEPGFKHFILKPEPDPSGEINWAKGYYDSMYGRINSKWKVSEGKVTYSATIPSNSTATLYMPAASEDDVWEGNIPATQSADIIFVKYENGKAIFELKSGSYEFSSQFSTAK